MDQNTKPAMTCSCPHHKVKATLVVLFGLTFLLSAMGTLSWTTVSYVWPILVIIAGLSMFCKCCSNA